jgi:hypothetical protein
VSDLYDRNNNNNVIIIINIIKIRENRSGELTDGRSGEEVTTVYVCASYALPE